MYYFMYIEEYIMLVIITLNTIEKYDTKYRIFFMQTTEQLGHNRSLNIHNLLNTYKKSLIIDKIMLNSALIIE